MYLSALRFASTCKRIPANRAQILAKPANNSTNAASLLEGEGNGGSSADDSLLQSLRDEVDTLRRQLLSLGSVHRAPRPQAGGNTKNNSSGNHGAGGGGGSARPSGESEVVSSLRREVATLHEDAEKEAERLHKMKEYIQRQHMRLKEEVRD